MIPHAALPLFILTVEMPHCMRQIIIMPNAINAHRPIMGIYLEVCHLAANSCPTVQPRFNRFSPFFSNNVGESRSKSVSSRPLHDRRLLISTIPMPRTRRSHCHHPKHVTCVRKCASHLAYPCPFSARAQQPPLQQDDVTSATLCSRTGDERENASRSAGKSSKGACVTRRSPQRAERMPYLSCLESGFS